MIKIALVGEIGSGKSYIAKLFGYPVFNADNEVANIYEKDKSCFIKLKKKLQYNFTTFPLKKDELTNSILQNNNNLKLITNIVHPLIKKKLKKFIKNNNKQKIVVLDIPLYLENKLNNKNDIIVFVQSKRKDILKRLTKRKGYNKLLINIFKKIQASIEKKKKKSQFVIKNDFTKRTALKYVRYILERVLK